MSIVKFYRGDSNAPKPTMGAHLGSNAIITCKGRLLLEKRRDSDVWGLVGGGVKNYETEVQAMAREVREELGIRKSFPCRRGRLSGVFPRGESNLERNSE